MPLPVYYLKYSSKRLCETESHSYSNCANWHFSVSRSCCKREARTRNHCSISECSVGAVQPGSRGPGCWEWRGDRELSQFTARFGDDSAGEEGNCLSFCTGDRGYRGILVSNLNWASSGETAVREKTKKKRNVLFWIGQSVEWVELEWRYRNYWRLRAQIPHLGTTDTWGQRQPGCRGPCCALWNIQKHTWPPATRG